MLVHLSPARHADRRPFSRPRACAAKWFTVNIPLCPRLARDEMVTAPSGTPIVTRRMKFANDHTRAVQASRPRLTTSSSPRSSSPCDMDIWHRQQAFSPGRRCDVFIGPSPSSASRRAVVNEPTRRSSPATPTGLSGLGTIPFQAPELAHPKLERVHGVARHAGSRFRRTSTGAEFFRGRAPPISSARGMGVVLSCTHPVHRRAPLRRPFISEYHPVSPLDRRCGASSDLWRVLEPIPG